MRLYLFATYDGTVTRRFYTEDGKRYWDGKQLCSKLHARPEVWIRTNCYIEVEL